MGCEARKTGANTKSTLRSLEAVIELTMRSAMLRVVARRGRPVGGRVVRVHHQRVRYLFEKADNA